MGHLRIQHQSKEPQNTIAKVLALGGGIEPPLTDSKSNEPQDINGPGNAVPTAVSYLQANY